MRCHSLLPAILAVAAIPASAATAAVPVRWTVETSRVQPAVFEAYQGETLELEAALQSYGKPIEIDPQADWNIYWQTNGMGSAYWSAPATIKASAPPSSTSTSTSSLHLLSATFTPSMDVGAKVYNCFIGSPSNIYRAAFQLRLRPSPGALPNSLPLPTPVIDFSRIHVLNPPWGSGGGGGCDTNAVVKRVYSQHETQYIDGEGQVFAITQGAKYWDLLEDYTQQHFIFSPFGNEWRCMGVVVPNLWAHLRYNKDSPDSQKWELYDGAYEIYGKFDGAEDAETLEMMPFGTATAKWKDPQFAKVDDVASSNWVERSFVPATRKVNGQPLTKDITVQGMTDNALVLTNGSVQTKSGAAITPAAVGAAAAEDLEPLSLDISRAYQYSRTIALYMTGNTNAWFAGTNYVFGSDAATRRRFAFEDGMDLATVPCSMALWEIRDGIRQCVWDQRDWPTWYWSFKAAQMQAEINASNALFRAEVNAAINSDEAHAWAKRYASTGRRNPDASTTFIDTPSVTLSPGMSWETVATVGGCGYWTIVGNGAVIGGSGTNATLNIKDFEGNSILEITKGQHMLAWLDSSDFVGQLTDADGWICFDVMADVKPTGYFSTTLVAADFVVEMDANCPAQYRWEDLGGHVWRVHFLLKPGIVSRACFAKFQVEVEGKTQIRYNADTVINGGLIFEGVKIAPVIQSGAAVGSTVTWKVVK